MSIELTMPRLSDTMESGTVIKWNVSEGDQVNSGDVIADIETDKATMEMQIYDDGTIGKILVPEGQAVNVGTAIAVLLEEDEEPGDQPAEVPAQHDAESSPVEPVNHESTPAEPIVEGGVDPEPVRPISSPPPRQEGQQRVRISPVARRLADEHGID
ncbi:MAG: pyruvate dehydrogenase complex dihydrolipoamide acetyltransferase, partial [Phycisphaerae bacterium]|nr:pyruvate dehydrogenase complex dihydrolipoamide acetyltransferase [Phycisphaerae bacterium]